MFIILFLFRFPLFIFILFIFQDLTIFVTCNLSPATRHPRKSPAVSYLLPCILAVVIFLEFH